MIGFYKPIHCLIVPSTFILVYKSQTHRVYMDSTEKVDVPNSFFPYVLPESQ